MTRVLLTGGSGFIAAHVLDLLLEHGHSVVTTVRSQEKANKIKESHPNASKDNLDFAIVEDIAQEGAFDKAVISDPPFEAVVHTASPFHFNVKDTKKDLLDPAIIGTTGILKAVKKSAPTVKRVVITSSFAAIVNNSGTVKPGHTYSEADWNPVTIEEASSNPFTGYRASKTFAEKAAWKFIEEEKPNFDLATLNPPFVFGPVVHYLNSLDALNTSNQRIHAAISGKLKDEVSDTSTITWIDVRDLAQAHVAALEKPEAGNKRFFVIAGYASNKDLVDIVRKDFPEYQDQLPGPNVKGAGVVDPPAYKFDNSRAAEVLGLKYISFEKSVGDTVKSLKAVGA